MKITTPLISVGGFDAVERSADPGAFVTWMAQQRQFAPGSGIAALQLSPTDRVLDLGSGPGSYAKVLREHTKHVVGLVVSVSAQEVGNPGIQDSSELRVPRVRHAGRR